MINPTWVNTFITLVNTGHFTQTAEKLFMTQPGVSQHIKKLEEQVGSELPESAVESFHQPQLLHVYPLKYQVSEALYLVKKRHRPLPRRYDWFITMLKATLTP